MKTKKYNFGGVLKQTLPGLLSVAGGIAGTAIGGPAGTAIGSTLGNTLGLGIGSMIGNKQNKQNTLTENPNISGTNLNYTNPYDQKSMKGNFIAKNGMKVKEPVLIEVEGGEDAYRKMATGGWVKIREYKGPSHENGGIKDVLKEGDVIVSRKNKPSADKLYQNGDMTGLTGLFNKQEQERKVLEGEMKKSGKSEYEYGGSIWKYDCGGKIRKMKEGGDVVPNTKKQPEKPDMASKPTEQPVNMEAYKKSNPLSKMGLKSIPLGEGEKKVAYKEPSVYNKPANPTSNTKKQQKYYAVLSSNDSSRKITNLRFEIGNKNEENQLVRNGKVQKVIHNYYNLNDIENEMTRAEVERILSNKFPKINDWDGDGSLIEIDRDEWIDTQNKLSKMLKKANHLDENSFFIEDETFESGGKIRIKPENRGKFTASANKAGMGVQEFANKVMANKEDYSPTLVKRANFAKNAAKWHGDGGVVKQQEQVNKAMVGNPHYPQPAEVREDEWDKTAKIMQQYRYKKGGIVRKYGPGGPIKGAGFNKGSFNKIPKNFYQGKNMGNYQNIKAQTNLQNIKGSGGVNAKTTTINKPTNVNIGANTTTKPTTVTNQSVTNNPDIKAAKTTINNILKSNLPFTGMGSLLFLEGDSKSQKELLREDYERVRNLSNKVLEGYLESYDTKEVLNENGEGEKKATTPTKTNTQTPKKESEGKKGLKLISQLGSFDIYSDGSKYNRETNEWEYPSTGTGNKVNTGGNKTTATTVNSVLPNYKTLFPYNVLGAFGVGANKSSGIMGASDAYQKVYNSGLQESEKKTLDKIKETNYDQKIERKPLLQSYNGDINAPIETGMSMKEFAKVKRGSGKNVKEYDLGGIVNYASGLTSDAIKKYDLNKAMSQINQNVNLGFNDQQPDNTKTTMPVNNQEQQPYNPTGNADLMKAIAEINTRPGVGLNLSPSPKSKLGSFLSNNKDSLLNLGQFIPDIIGFGMSMKKAQKMPEVKNRNLVYASQRLNELPTEFDIKPQLAQANRVMSGYNQSVNNMAGSNANVRNARLLAGQANFINSTNELYGQKFNAENQMKANKLSALSNLAYGSGESQTQREYQKQVDDLQADANRRYMMMSYLGNASNKFYQMQRDNKALAQDEKLKQMIIEANPSMKDHLDWFTDNPKALEKLKEMYGLTEITEKKFGGKVRKKKGGKK